jgi:TolB-like protein/class 3 adenylate cyclase
MSEVRKLAAILIADVVGYSRLAGVDEEGTLARLRVLRNSVIDPVVAARRGRIVKSTGDGAIVEFRSAVDAVRCAIEIQNGMVQHDASVAEEKKIVFRIGIHVIEEMDGDLMGDGVNIAARLEGLCEPGGVYLSGSAHEQVVGRVGVNFTDLGEQALENIARPIRAYALTPEAVTAARVDRLEDSPSLPLATGCRAPPRLSIVVLPFANIGGDPEQDYFVDEVIENLTTDLSRVRGSFVIARNTAYAYKGRSFDITKIGRELNVRYTLEGSVQRNGNRMRVNVQLVSVQTGNHLWAERFEKPVTDLFEMQDEVVARIANTTNSWPSSVRLFPASVFKADAPRGLSQIMSWSASPPGEPVAHTCPSFLRGLQGCRHRPESGRRRSWNICRGLLSPRRPCASWSPRQTHPSEHRP